MEEDMFFGAWHLIFENAKELRKNMTDAERLLWFHLKKKPLGFKFRSQHPVNCFIADFYCHKAKLVIELDGSIHDLEDVKENDFHKQRLMEEYGLKVMRFTNKEVFNKPQDVVMKIIEYLRNIETLKV